MTKPCLGVGLIAAMASFAPAAVAGAIKASLDYSSGLIVVVYESGSGRFILSTLLIHEYFGTNPVAERLLRHRLNYATGRST